MKTGDKEVEHLWLAFPALTPDIAGKPAEFDEPGLLRV